MSPRLSIRASASQMQKNAPPLLCQTELNGWCVQLSFAASSGQFPKFEAVIDCAACRERQAGFSRFGEHAGGEGAFAVVDEDFDRTGVDENLQFHCIHLFDRQRAGRAEVFGERDAAAAAVDRDFLGVMDPR